MKRICLSCAMALALCSAHDVRGQDAATEERLNRLSGQIEDLIASHKAQQKQMAELAKAIESLRAQIDKPSANYATTDDLRKVAERLAEVDRKRIDDAERVRTELLSLTKALTRSTAPSGGSRNPVPDTPKVSEKGFWYVIESGDTLSLIVQAYREKNIKITAEQILKANPGLKAERMPVGKKIFIPAPQT